MHRLWSGGTSVPSLELAVPHLLLLPCLLSESQASTHLSSDTRLATGSGPGLMAVRSHVSILLGN